MGLKLTVNNRVSVDIQYHSVINSFIVIYGNKSKMLVNIEIKKYGVSKING